MLGVAWAAWGWAALTLAVPDQSRASPAPDHSIAGRSFRLAPLGLALPGPGASDDLRVFDRAVRVGFRWGFSLGVTFEPVEHLLLDLSAGVHQTIWMFDNDTRRDELCFAGDCYGWTERTLGCLIGVGPELRVGWTSRWWMAWALLGGQLGLSRVRLDCDNSVEAHCGRSETDVGAGLAGGLGLAIRASPRFAVGVESSVAHAWLDRRDDPFEAARAWTLALLVIVRF